MTSIAFYGILFLLGLIFGSFFNVIVWRTRMELPVGWNRSLCPACRRQLFWYDNIPLVSFCCLGGVCRFCRVRIELRYPIGEFLTGFIFVFIGWSHQVGAAGITLPLIRDLLIAAFLLLTFWYDWLYGQILDAWTLWPAIVLFFLAGFLGWNSWTALALGAMIGGGWFWLQFILSRGRWIGAGDIRLGIFIGIILGWPMIAVGLFLAYISGASVGLALLAGKKKQLADPIPFGTYLTAATLVTMFYGPRLLSWYLSLL